MVQKQISNSNPFPFFLSIIVRKTSDLIPLCHPLPLDQVQMEIKVQGNQVIIDCTCRVTHKTGVEMEALTGATVAALTIYDMVKAVSHQVQIIDTRLIAKKGGKRTAQWSASRIVKGSVPVVSL